MDVRTPPPPTFTPGPSQHRPDLLKRLPTLLEERIKVLEAKLESLTPTLSKATVAVLNPGPNDTVVFTVPNDVDLLNGLHSRLAESLKADLGVRKVLFAHEGVSVSVLSPKE